MSEYAASHVSDEVGTAGNAINWMFLADQLAEGREVKPEGQWVWDMARSEVGESEVRLLRDRTT